MKEAPVRAELLATMSVEPRSLVTRDATGRWLLHTPGEVLVALGPMLDEQARFPMPTRWFSTHAVSPDGKHAYLSLRKSVRCITATGETVWDVPHAPWGNKEDSSGSCWVSPDGAEVWATVPSPVKSGTLLALDSRTHELHAAPAKPDEWWVLDARSGALLRQTTLASHGVASAHLPHPDGKHVGLKMVTGATGVDAYWGRRDSERLTAERLGATARDLLDVRPGGTQFLAMVRGRDSTALTVFPFPDGPAVASREAKDTFPPTTDYPGGPDSFSGYAQYVTADLVLVGSSREANLALLSAEDLSLVAPLQGPGSPVATDGRGHFVTYDSVKSLRLWALPD